MLDWFDLILGDANRVAHPLQTTEHEFLGVRAEELKDGYRVPKWPAGATLRVGDAEHDGDADDFLGEHLGLPVMSARLQKALVDADVGVRDLQFLPVRVIKWGGHEIGGFAIANVISRVMALDYERSILLEQEQDEIDPATGKPKVWCIGKIALKAEPLRGHDIVRLVEFPSYVLVSRRFVDVVRKGKFTGATFSKLKVS